MKSQQEYMKNVSTIYLFSQFLLNFPSMPFSSDFRMLIPQQSSTTPVRPAESINTKTEVFFMRELRNTKIIAVDHGYGNMKQQTPSPQPASKPMKLNQSSPGIFWNTTAFTTGSAKDTKNLSRIKLWTKNIIF